MQVQVRDIMTTSVACVGSHEPVTAAACRMRDLDVGVLPVRDGEDVLTGVVTDRDLVVSVLADGMDPASTAVGDLVRRAPLTIGLEADIESAARLMSEQRVRRLVVVSGRWVVGIVSQGDLARALPEHLAGALVEAVSA